MIVEVPSVKIETPSGEITNQFNPTSISFSGSIFSQGQAIITGVEKGFGTLHGTSFYNVWDFSGLWKIYFVTNTSTSLVWQGYCMPSHSDRKSEVMKREFQLKDVTEAWNVLLTNKVYGDGAGYTVGNLISDLAAGAAAGSGVASDYVADNSTLLTDLFDSGYYVVTNSTYLAELNKVLQWSGMKLFADPIKNKISIISPTDTSPFGALPISSSGQDIISASFDLDPTNIPTVVVVGDEVLGKAVSYGHLGDTPDDTNYNIRKFEKPAFVTTYGVKDEATLSSLAQKIYNLGRQGSQKLTIIKAGYFTSSPLWKTINWTDANGSGGSYKVVSFRTDITPRYVHTTLEAIP